MMLQRYAFFNKKCKNYLENIYLCKNFNRNKLKNGGLDTLLIDLFGRDAQIDYNNYIEPILIEGSEHYKIWMVEYFTLFIILGISSLVIHKFSDSIGRIFSLAFSFPKLIRQLKSINHSIDVASVYISSLIFLLSPLILSSHHKFFQYNTFFDELGYNKILLYIALSIAIFLYSSLTKFLFHKMSKNIFFYRKLFFTEKICISTYVITLIPVVLLSSVSSPFQKELVITQFLLIIGLYLHYTFVNFKLFIEENVSYIQLILYFCTVKAVILGFIIYFGIFVI